MKGLPLDTVDDPYLHDFLHYLQPTYQPCVILKEHINNVGVEKVAWLVTDNTAACKLAPQLVCKTNGFMHIQDGRCQMHAFALGMTSSVAHEFFKLLITDALKVVTFFCASHEPLALLK
ncbi:hypothetical protein TSOC_013862 [Tetrabaena socialis]|uniref:DUF659 domain-containing protein n=1 Tax=Tetrabaena socialis TaxID=47790 RepID=A0A2J7ZJ88_9CHLO|nr:hypothetical protein TSOC_013862 [Tetrabaena socialis]|eukprot:PNH00326.1 hypothetical protein TSOC_013862 [Tetrabaena socialis]